MSIEDSIVVAGAEDEYPEGHCQNCGFDLSDIPRTPSHRSFEVLCPKCNQLPMWTGSKTKSKTLPELLTCDSCDEKFVRRVRYTTHVEKCGDKTRTRVSRFGAWPRCGACDEISAARRHEEAAAACRSRATEKRASQRRNAKKHAALASSNWQTIASKATEGEKR